MNPTVYECGTPACGCEDPEEDCPFIHDEFDEEEYDPDA